MRRCRLHLELGGKAPVLPHPGIDLTTAAKDIVATGFANSGQDCTAARCVIVHEAAHDEFVSYYLKEASTIKVGASLNEATTMGPLVSLPHRDSVQGFVDRAKGYSTIALGGEAAGEEGYSVLPTVILEAGQDSEIVQEEVFSPVVSIQKSQQRRSKACVGQRSPVRPCCERVEQRPQRHSAGGSRARIGHMWINTHQVVGS